VEPMTNKGLCLGGNRRGMRQPTPANSRPTPDDRLATGVHTMKGKSTNNTKSMSTLTMITPELADAYLDDLQNREVKWVSQGTLTKPATFYIRRFPK
jgi:hypothetical protein